MAGATKGHRGRRPVADLDDRIFGLEAELGRLPTDAELSAVTGQKLKAMPAILDAVMKEDAFYTPVAPAAPAAAPVAPAAALAAPAAVPGPSVFHKKITIIDRLFFILI